MPYRLATELEITPGQRINFYDIKLDSLRFDKAGIYFRLKAGYEDTDGTIHWNMQGDKEVRIQDVDPAQPWYSDLMTGKTLGLSRFEEHKHLLYQTLRAMGKLPDGDIL